jgi:hypothetical protein
LAIKAKNLTDMVKGSGGSLNIWIKKLENKNKKKQKTNLIFLPV